MVCPYLCRSWSVPIYAAFASGELSPASGAWLDPAQPAPIPAQVAEVLNGQKFSSFGDLRSAIWQTIAGNDELNGGFSPANLAIMGEGNAPFAPRIFQTSELSDAGLRFNLHHIEPVGLGGSVYDLSNLQIVSPSVHYSIHYGP